MQCQEVTVPGGGGIDLRVKVYSPEARVPAFVPVIVAVHDLGVCGDMFAPLMPDLATEDPANASVRLRSLVTLRRHPMSRAPNAPPKFIEAMYLVTYDQRGHGRSTDACVPVSNIDMATLVGDCVRVLEHVEANLFRNHQIFLLSHGLGTAVALGAAAQVNRDTQKAIHGLVALRDWIDDAPSFAALSQLARRPARLSSVNEGISWYTEQGALYTKAAAARVVPLLLKATAEGDGVEWIVPASDLPIDRLITESLEVLRESASTFTPPSVIVTGSAAATATRSLASCMTNARAVGVTGDGGECYYVSADAPREVVKAVRDFVNEVNRDPDEPEDGHPGRSVGMMPRPGL